MGVPCLSVLRGCKAGCRKGRHRKKGDAEHPAALLCHPSADGQLRYPHRAGIARPQGCVYHYGLCACTAAERDQVGEESVGPGLVM